MNLLNPFSASPSVSFRVSSLILRRYSQRATAVEISFPVKAIGLPIWVVTSRASSSVLSVSHLRAFFTMACLSANEVFLHSWNASAEVLGISSTSSAEMPLRVMMGSFVLGEMVVRTSTDILVCWQRTHWFGMENEEEEVWSDKKNVKSYTYQFMLNL